MEPDASPRPFVLEGSQRTLYEELCRRHPTPGAMYLGALMVLRQQGNPDRLALAAHSLRELMEKLPRYVDVPSALPPGDMKPQVTKDRIQQLGALWKHVIAKSRCHNAGKWAGELDNPLKRFLGAFGDFHVWYEKEIPTVGERVGKFLRQLDPSSQPIPATLVKNQVNQWQSFYQFFTAVSHHGKPTNESEMNARILEIEAFLADILVPRTFDRFNAIDELIREAEDAATT
jgi:hypothetical protein